VETFYRAAKRTVFDESSWPAIPDAVKGTVTAEVFRAFSERVRNAFDAGTIDARDDRHFSWTGFLLDQQGWDELIRGVDALFYSAFEIAEAAESRLGTGGEEPIHMTVSLAAFESPKDSAKAPRCLQYPAFLETQTINCC
jgi:hypothetical protein